MGYNSSRHRILRCTAFIMEAPMKTYGYIRVSIKEQITDRQDIALRDASLPKEMIFTDRLSGKSFDRPAYQRLIKKLRPGDTLLSRALTGLAEIMMKFRSSGALSRGSAAARLLSWICPCWTPGRTETELESLLRTSSYRFSAMWQRLSGNSFAPARRRVLRLQRKRA